MFPVPQDGAEYGNYRNGNCLGNLFAVLLAESRHKRTLGTVDPAKLSDTILVNRRRGLGPGFGQPTRWAIREWWAIEQAAWGPRAVAELALGRSGIKLEYSGLKSRP